MTGLDSRQRRHDQSDSLLSAIPFAVSPEEAIQQSGLKVCFHIRNYPAFIRTVFSKFSSTLYEPPRPIRIEPVYFPTWLVDAEVTAKILEHTDDSTVQVNLQCHSCKCAYSEMSCPDTGYCSKFINVCLDVTHSRLVCLTHVKAIFRVCKSLSECPYD